MDLATFTEFADDCFIVAGVLGGILLVLIFSIVWGYQKHD